MMDVPSRKLVRAGSLEELKAKGRLVLHGGDRPILVIHDRGHVWGEPALPKQSTAVWLTRPRGIQWRTTLDALQVPGTTLWRRQMVLGPGKEFALIVPPGLNVAAPAGWSALAIERVRVDAPANSRPK
jgi:hypothetical protein